MCRPQNNVPTFPIDPFGRTSVTNRLSNSLFDRTSCVCAASSSGLTPGNMLLFALRQLTRVTVPLNIFLRCFAPGVVFGWVTKLVFLRGWLFANDRVYSLPFHRLGGVMFLTAAQVCSLYLANATNR